MVSLYAEVYGHDRTTASTYINDNVVVCILEHILTSAEQQHELTLLKDEECDNGQGFLFARPLDSAGIEEFFGQGKDAPLAQPAT